MARPIQIWRLHLRKIREYIERDSDGVSIIVRPEHGAVTGVIMEMPPTTANTLAHALLSVAPDRQRRRRFTVDESGYKASTKQS